MARELGAATRQPAEGQGDAKLPVGREVAVEEPVELGIVRIDKLGRRIIVKRVPVKGSLQFLGYLLEGIHTYILYIIKEVPKIRSRRIQDRIYIY